MKKASSQPLSKVSFHSYLLILLLIISHVGGFGHQRQFTRESYFFIVSYCPVLMLSVVKLLCYDTRRLVRSVYARIVSGLVVE